MGKKPDLRGLVGVDLLHDPTLNKGTAFSEAERDALGLRGLLPPRVTTMEQQLLRVLGNLRRKPSDLEKYVYLIALQERNENLFYRLVIENIEETMPLLYTPTVGQACEKYGLIFRRPRGLFLCSRDRGQIARVMQNWPHKDVRMVVVTDGERILGLGDLGANGMGIPVGKLSLYTACAGVPPHQCMPVMLDVGTDNESLLLEPLYIGTAQRRVRGEAYDALVDEFVDSTRQLFPNACIQFEDFGNANAFRLLRKYRDAACVFNDDIQGTAAVALAGIYSALRLTDGRLPEQRFLFYGAGEAGIGIGDLVVEALRAEGLPTAEARQRCWFMDSKGLVVASRSGLAEHKRRFAHEHAPVAGLEAAVEALRPTAIIGVSGRPSAFTEPVIRGMSRLHRTPIVFALSNPTSKSECTAEEAYTWSEGRAVFASGSPFPPLTLEGRTYSPGQANNAYVFPGLGLGVVASEATRVTDAMFFVAAKTLAGLVAPEDLAEARIFPKLTRIREVSKAIAIAVAEVAFQSGLARIPRPDDTAALVASCVYEPKYAEYA